MRRYSAFEGIADVLSETKHVADVRKADRPGVEGAVPGFQVRLWASKRSVLLAFLFSISMRALAAGPDEAGF